MIVTEMSKMLRIVDDDNCMSKPQICNWYRQFKVGRENAVH